MKKKIQLLLVLAVLLVSLIPAAVRASDELTVLDMSAEVNFPTSLTFNISARSDVNIADIRLHYTVDRMQIARVVSEVYISFTPAKTVTTQYVLDMRRTGGIPPGTYIDYWWTVTDVSGKAVVTIVNRIQIEDERYSWKSLTEGQVTLFWYKGDDAFAGELMDAVQQALGRLAENSGAALESPVSLYIYASQSDLLGSMIFPQEWTGGVAFSQYGVITIGIGTTASQLAWGKGAITHELTHLVIHQVTFNPYNDLPTWLDEGMAMYSEGGLGPEFTSALASAEENQTLITVRSLSSPFSAYTEQSILAYAESYDIVAYLIGEYGRDKMFELLGVFKEGSGYDEALMKVYGFDMDGLNSLWQAAAAGVATN